MNFTREPIIETIISAREGYKLAIKSSKSGSEEECLVDAVEVVSFGGTFFYRCQDKPRPFFLPAADYDILEVRETRLLLKNPVIEKSIKIAGGKEAFKGRSEGSEGKEKSGSREQREPKEPRESREPRGESREQKEVKEMKAPKEPREETPRADAAASEGPAEPDLAADRVQDGAGEDASRGDPKRDRKRYRKGRRSLDDNKPHHKTDEKGEPIVLPLNLPHLLRPPENLISDSIHKYKKQEPLSPSPSVQIEPPVDLSPPQAGAPETPPTFDAYKDEIAKDDQLISEPPQPRDYLEEHQDDVFVRHAAEDMHGPEN